MRIFKTCLFVVLLVSLTVFSASSANAQAHPPAWSAAATYHTGDQTQVNGNVMRAVTNPTKGKFLYSQWELWELRNSATYLIGIGQTFTSLSAAWTFIQNARIASGAFLHLFISYENGIFVENFSAPFSLDHAFGSQISIIGEGSSNVTLAFTGLTSDGLLIDSAHHFGSISNITLTSTNSGSAAIHAVQNSTIDSITNLSIGSFSFVFFAEYGSKLVCGTGLLLNSISEIICEAYEKSTIIMPDGVTVLSNGPLWAFYAYGDSYVQAHNAIIKSTANSIAYALNGSFVDVSGSTMENAGEGVFADQSCHVNAENCTIAGSTYEDLDAEHGSTIDAIGASFTTSSGTVYTS